ncbi:MAG: phospholipid scramblase-related protein [Ilumatobacteraceae bacterium]|jgi:uncharacterized protein YxjI
MSSHPAAWHADPTGRHQYRYWDGQNWTDHVSDNGIQSTDPVQQAPRMDRFDSAMTVGNEGDPERIRQQVRGDDARRYRSAQIGEAAFVGGGTIFTEPVLVVNQKAKLIELRNEYGVFDQNGQRIASVTQTGQSAAKKLVRLAFDVDQFLTHKLEISDAQGRVIIRLTRPAKLVKSKIVVSDGNDNEIGRIVQDNVFGKIHFTMEAGGQNVGSINAENWRAWNFNIQDATGAEVARITKTFEGIAKTIFTTADNYVVQIHRVLPQPLNALVVAAALSVDTALKQDSRGLN